MYPKLMIGAIWLLILCACGRLSPESVAPTGDPGSPTEPSLVLEMVYPTAAHSITKSQPIKFTVELHDDAGNGIRDAQVQITVRDAGGEAVATLPAKPVPGRASYLTDYWQVPSDALPGKWGVVAEARQKDVAVQAATPFQVENGTADVLREKYGIWIDPPALGGISPSLMDERGDAADGMFTWGGILPGMHILKTNWIEVNWRTGNYDLTTAAAVEQFLLGELGDIGFSPIRAFTSIEPYRFQRWEGWKVGVRSRVGQELVEWVVFYAPEVDKTFGIGTTVVIPPPNIDAHAALRDSFRVYPEMEVDGKAPKPIRRLVAGPRLLGPELGSRFVGAGETIVLTWEPLRELTEDEYYEVIVDFDYGEGNPRHLYTTRDTTLTVPESLYHEPNCHVFNWQVTLKRSLGETYADGTPKGEALTFPTLYPYFIWDYPATEQEPFTMYCPNEQI